MVEIKLREGLRTATLVVAGKVPITAHSSHPLFHNSMELLCCGVGACISKVIQQQCYLEKEPVSQFEEIIVTMEDFKIKVCITYPSDINPNFLELIKTSVLSCPAHRILDFDTDFILGKIQKKDIVKKESKGCCG